MYELSPKCYTLTPSEGHRFIDVLKCMKVPFGYGSNICWCITFMDHEFYGLKSHGRVNVIVVTYSCMRFSARKRYVTGCG